MAVIVPGLDMTHSLTHLWKAQGPVEVCQRSSGFSVRTRKKRQRSGSREVERCVYYSLCILVVATQTRVLY